MKKIHRFFYKFDDIEKSVIEISNYEIVNQIFSVLKLKRGENIIIFDDKVEVICSIRDLNRKLIIADILEKKNIIKKDININLYCAVLKKDNFEIVIQKVTELGVDNVYPIITDRTIKTNLNFDRLEKIIKESCEQSGRTDIPVVFDICNLKNIEIDGKSLNILFNMNGINPINDIKDIKKYKNINLFVGPEGGWTENELLFFKRNKCRIYSLNKNVLRGETAAIFGVGVISMLKNN